MILNTNNNNINKNRSGLLYVFNKHLAKKLVDEGYRLHEYYQGDNEYWIFSLRADSMIRLLGEYSLEKDFVFSNRLSF